jgi:hypothetical protein
VKLLRYILIATIVVVGILYWQWNHPPENKLPAPTEVAAMPDQPAGQSLSLIPVVTNTVTSNVAISSPSTFEETMALIHLKLRQWSETQTGDRETQDRLQNELLAMLTDDNAAEIIQALSPEELDGPFGISALFHWMKVDPVTAANWIASRPDATEDQAWVVAHNLLADGIDLQNYSDQLPDTGWRQQFLADAGLEVLSKSPNEAISLAQQMNPGSAQTNLLQTVAADWISNDPNKALDWILSVNDPAMQEQLIAAGAKAYATTDPKLAAEWFVSSVKSEAVLNNTLPNIVEIWAAQDSPTAADWVAQLPEGNLKDAALETIASYWQQSDPGAAARWILTLPESDQTEPATYSQ